MLKTTTCSKKYTRARRLCFKIRKTQHWSLASGPGHKTTSIKQFVCWKLPLGIPNNKLLWIRKTLPEELRN